MSLHPAVDPFTIPSDHHGLHETALRVALFSQKDFNFTGGLKPRMKKLFADLNREYPGYGGGANKQIVRGMQTSGDLDLSVFNEDNLEEH